MDLESLGRPVPESPTYIGGVRFTRVPFDFGWPAARLVVFDGGVWIGPSALIFRLFIPERRFRFDDCNIQSIGQSFLATGIRFQSRETGGWVIFWSRKKRGTILRELQSRSSEVKVEPIPLDFFRPRP
jgi:hypothetical protein